MPPTPDPVPRPLDHLAECGATGDTALVLRAERLSFDELRTRVARLAGWLRAQVPGRGARVASWAATGELTCLLPLAAPSHRLAWLSITPLGRPVEPLV